MSVNTNTRELGDLDKTIEVLEAMVEHRKAHPTDKSAQLYYEAMAKYFRSMRNAPQEGKFFVGHSPFAPVEIFYAMDMVPAHLALTGSIISQLNKAQPKYLQAAAGFGMPWELCAAHRLGIGVSVKRSLPHFNAIVSTLLGCDNAAISARTHAALHECPIYLLDFPYGETEPEIKYVIRELEGLIAFLEEHSGRKLDWDRLKEVVKLSWRETQLWQAIGNMRKAVPAPLRSRFGQSLYALDMFMVGLPEALACFEAAHSEVKENLEKKTGPMPQNYRLLTLMMPPVPYTKFMDWMEKEHGLVTVMDVFYSHWKPVEMDANKPLESLARKYLNRPAAYQMRCPIDELVDSVVKDAIDYKIDGAIYYASVTCHQGPPTIKPIKDALLKETGVPMLILDMDPQDPSYMPESKMRAKVEEFLEILEGNK